MLKVADGWYQVPGDGSNPERPLTRGWPSTGDTGPNVRAAGHNEMWAFVQGGRPISIIAIGPGETQESVARTYSKDYARPTGSGSAKYVELCEKFWGTSVETLLRKSLNLPPEPGISFGQAAAGALGFAFITGFVGKVLRNKRKTIEQTKKQEEKEKVQV